jgi:LmbE family N-acetylglucosaminyl deacetylase
METSIVFDAHPNFKARLSRQAERTWVALASAVSPFVSPRAAPLAGTPKSARVLVIAPHPDDEATIAGTVRAHLTRGDHVAIAIVTDGRASRQRALTPDQMATLRKAEAEQARSIMQPSSWAWLGLPDLDFDEQVLVGYLRSTLATAPPDVIYAPSCVDGHPDHLRCGRALAQSLSVSFDGVIRCYQVQIPLTPLLVNVAVDVSPFADIGLRAMEAHSSQRESWARIVRMKRYAAALYGGEKWVDEFWELDATAYRSIHLPREPRQIDFVGLRPNAFRDPVAYVAGFVARKHLLNIARSAPAVVTRSAHG